MALILGIDIGGTFTDIVSVETSTREFILTKVPSTPRDFSQGFFNSIDKIMEMTEASAGDILRLAHGTTVSTNCIIEHKGSKIGVLTTKGFEDTLIIGRGTRSKMYSLFNDPETPVFLCDRQRFIGIDERVDYKGGVLRPLNEADVVEALDILVEREGVQAIAVVYLFSFLNPTHEIRTEQIIHERYPKMKVSLSSTINPMFREYERMCITCFNAYIGTEIESYINLLEEGLAKRGINVVLQVMQSRGGITNSTMCIEKPVVTLLSGPAAGVVGAMFVGKAAGGAASGRENLISFDMGGTSSDVSLIPKGKATLSLEGKIDRYPLRQSMMEVSTIGAGGGSIAWIDAAGVLKVGPQSAGSDPGPACYNRGGDEPTVTDASLVLGYLNPESFAGGAISLNLELSQKAIQERIAKPLDMDLYEAAAGIHRIVNNNMADQIRLVSVYRGFHPNDFSLIAFGGAGPVSAGRVSELLSMKEVIVPRNPGVLSAFGLLVADIEHEEVGTLVGQADKVDPEDITKKFRSLEKICEQKREGIGITSTNLDIMYSAEMRYVGQGYELEIPFPRFEDKLTKKIIQEVVRRFHSAHEAIYKHNAPDSPVEFVALRVVYRQTPFLIPKLREIASGAEGIPKFFRKAYFDEYPDCVNTPIYERSELGSGQIIKGPAIVEQEDTTIVIYPHYAVMVDKFGNLIMTRIND
ncbi:MAG: hydantoinase/oxoprolinase family protein [Deltaproteobacteria bacterium]|nr:hydantoinase/oxoprolinase family protein [Deltaproteobacteria bacterium]